jgi:hypothetical protein
VRVCRPDSQRGLSVTRLRQLTTSAWTWVVLGAAGVLALVGGCKTITVETVVHAKPATVWRVLSDAKGFERWNPVHVQVEGEFVEGEVLTIHVKDGDGKVSSFASTVRRVVPERELHQGGGVPGLLTFSHSFRLEPIADGTRVVQREEFRGLGVLFVDLDWVEPGYNQVNAALKRQAEDLEKTGM